MKIEIITTAKAVEKANYLLARAIESVEGSDTIRRNLGLNITDLTKIKRFRKKLINGFLRTSKK